jgi:ribose transport system substrate-binding protein
MARRQIALGAAALALIAVAMIAAGVGSASSKATFKVGVVLPTLNNPFFVDMKGGVTAAAKQFGVSVQVVDGQNDVNQQTKEIETFIAQKVNALVIQPVDTAGIVAAVKEANAAHIPVFTTAETPSGGEIVTKIIFDETKDGVIAGQTLGKALKAGSQVAELQGILGTSTARDRSKGFEQGLKLACPSCKIVAKQPANFDRATALTVMENILQRNKGIAGVYGANDEMALGALRAIQGASLKGVKIVGNDGETAAVTAITQQQMVATVAVPAFPQGYMAVELAAKYLAGKKLCGQVLERGVLITAANAAKAQALTHNVGSSGRYWESCVK